MPAFRTLGVPVLATVLSLHLSHGAARADDAGTTSGVENGRSRADAIVGYWQRGEGEALIEIQPRSDGYYGVIVASERRPESVGTEIFRALQYDSGRGLWLGRVYSMDRERDFKIQMKLPDPDHFVIRLRLLFFSRSVQFSRRSMKFSSTH